MADNGQRKKQNDKHKGTTLRPQTDPSVDTQPSGHQQQSKSTGRTPTK
jgi:hypothetical protein